MSDSAQESSTKHILDVCRKMWDSEEPKQRQDAVGIMQDLQKRDDNPFIALTLAQWHYEMEAFDKCQEVVDVTFQSFTKEFKTNPKAEEVITRLVLFKANAIEKQGNVKKAIEAAENGLKDVKED